MEVESRFWGGRVAAVLAAASVVPSHAAADDVTATILWSTPFLGTGQSGAIGTFDCTTPDASCDKGTFSGLHRRLYLAAPTVVQTADTGVVGFMIPITRRNVSFTLRSEPASTADFDITFYTDLGGLPNTAPGTYPVGVRSLFSRFGNRAETGTVPAAPTSRSSRCGAVSTRSSATRASRNETRRGRYRPLFV